MANLDAICPSFIFPDVLGDWPFKRNDNPALDLVQADNRKWFQNLGISTKYQKTFEGCNAALICAIAYPLAPPIHVRLAADLTLLQCLIDDITDHLNPTETQEFAGVIKDVLR